jgi:hypothetical protein
LRAALDQHGLKSLSSSSGISLRAKTSSKRQRHLPDARLQIFFGTIVFERTPKTQRSFIALEERPAGRTSQRQADRCAPRGKRYDEALARNEYFEKVRLPIF